MPRPDRAGAGFEGSFMAVTQQDVDAIEAAIATGALRVRYADGREVTYRSLAEMREIVSMLKNSVGISPAFTRTSVAGF